jgi:hypothetical protein
LGSPKTKKKNKIGRSYLKIPLLIADKKMLILCKSICILKLRQRNFGSELNNRIFHCSLNENNNAVGNGDDEQVMTVEYVM